jgi:hypothetical protein
MWRILPKGTTDGMSIPQNLALTVVMILAVLGFFTVLGFVSIHARPGEVSF